MTLFRTDIAHFLQLCPTKNILLPFAAITLCKLNHMKILLLYLLAVNAVTFVLYGIDKRRAQRGAWRIPEKTLLILPLLGGSVGGILGMRLFRHKTKHWYFRYGLVLLFLAQTALGIYLWLR